MKYLAAVCTVFMILTIPLLASEQTGSTPRDKFKAFLIEELLPKEIQSGSSY